MILINRGIEQRSFRFFRGRGRFVESHVVSFQPASLHLGVDNPSVGREGVGDFLRVLGVFVVFQRRNGGASEFAHILRAFLHHDLLLFFGFLKDLIVHRDFPGDGLGFLDGSACVNSMIQKV